MLKIGKAICGGRGANPLEINLLYVQVCLCACTLYMYMYESVILTVILYMYMYMYINPLFLRLSMHVCVV